MIKSITHLFRAFLFLLLFQTCAHAAAGGVGTLDKTFGVNKTGIVTLDLGANEIAQSVMINQAGDIYLTGTTRKNVGGGAGGSGLYTKPILAKFDGAGILNDAFGNKGSIVVDIDSGYYISGGNGFIDSDDNIFITGDLSGLNGQTNAIVKFTNADVLDSTFGTGGISSTTQSSFIFTRHAELDNGERILIGGEGYNVGLAQTYAGIARFNPDGTPDQSFAKTGFFLKDFSLTGLQNGINSIIVNSDNSMFVVGRYTSSSKSTIFIAKVKENGDLDLTYGGDGTWGSEGFVKYSCNDMCGLGSASIDQGGNILIAGAIAYNLNTSDYNSDILLLKFDASGKLVSSFGNAGIVISNFGKNEGATSHIIDKNGKIIVVGASIQVPGTIAWNAFIARYTSNGALETQFGTSGITTTQYGISQIPLDVKLDSNGNILIAGHINYPGISESDIFMARYVGAVCGDNLLDGNEFCDDGNTQSGDGCSADCKKIEKCGDGILDTGEQCDDGNVTNGDGCSSVCTKETLFSPPPPLPPPSVVTTNTPSTGTGVSNSPTTANNHDEDTNSIETPGSTTSGSTNSNPSISTGTPTAPSAGCSLLQPETDKGSSIGYLLMLVGSLHFPLLLRSRFFLRS